MRRSKQAGLVSAGALALTLSLVAHQSAFADYGPTTSDVVGVGSDTVQYAGDFVADGDHLGDTGYNALGNVNRVVNFDATADANARFAYAAVGLGGTCAPGTGGTAGTGNQTTTHADTPCGLDPTIVLRAGLNPVLRPNGSGAGYDALLRDTSHYIDYARSSTCQGSGTGCRGKVTAGYDSVQIGSDPLAMLKTTTSHAVPLSAAQLKDIYTCVKTTWTQVGGTSGNTIIPVVPQVGSGTRSSFLAAIGVGTPGSCTVTAEENDPTALAAQTSPDDAIEPMSGGRLNLFQGKLGNGAANGVGGYFKDPSCAVEVTTPTACTTGATINPAVTLVTTGTPSDAGALFNISRPLYIYFRHADINNATVFQPGSKLNWVRTLFYNPCDGFIAGACSGPGGTTYGPGGAPYYATSAGQALVSAAGILPAYVFTLNGP